MKGHGGCEQRSEVIVKMQKNKSGESGGLVGVGDRGDRGREFGGCEPRIVKVLYKIKNNKNIIRGGGGMGRYLTPKHSQVIKKSGV